MSWLFELRLIRLFNFYLALVFLLSTTRRIQQYRTIGSLVGNMPGRWPRLLELIKQYRTIFLTWGTVMPLVLSLVLLLLNTLASRLVWPRADYFTAGQLMRIWPVLPVVVVCAGAMIGLDLYGSWKVGTLDQAEMEKYFDQAEYWLKSWAAPVVNFVTMGRINPRQMVDVEVRNALVNASKLLNYTLWWMVWQTGLRIACGLSLWSAYALQPWLARLLHQG